MMVGISCGSDPFWQDRLEAYNTVSLPARVGGIEYSFHLSEPHKPFDKLYKYFRACSQSYFRKFKPIRGLAIAKSVKENRDEVEISMVVRDNRYPDHIMTIPAFHFKTLFPLEEETDANQQ